jgi:hypothetical protein
VEEGFEKIILQFTTDFENALLKKGGLMINYGLLAGLWIPPNVFKKAV